MVLGSKRRFKSENEIISLFSPVFRQGRVALLLGIELDGEENETGQVGCPILIRCDLWDNNEAGTTERKFKVKLWRFKHGFKLLSIFLFHTSAT